MGQLRDRDPDETVETLRVFTFEELASATSNFKGGNVIGEGTFGRVYKGWLREDTLSPAKNGRGMAVAVKNWKPCSLSGLEEWQVNTSRIPSIKKSQSAK